MKIRKRSNWLISICLLCLVAVPVFTMNRQSGKISETENRALASFPRLFDSEGRLEDGVKSGFESWWSDNLGLRSEFVELATNIQLKLLHQPSSDKVEIGRDDWYFLTIDHNVELAAGKYYLSQEMLEDIGEKQQRISDWYASQGTQYVLVLTPAKTSIYPEYLASGDYGVRKTICDQVEEYLTEHTTVEVVNTKTALLENKDLGKLFFQHDAHFTQLGAYVAYQAVAERLDELGFTMKQFPVQFEDGEQYGGDIANFLGGAGTLGSETVPYAHWDQTSTAVQSGELFDALYEAGEEHKADNILLRNDMADNGTMLIYSDSQWNSERPIAQWLGESFQTVGRMWQDSMELELEETFRPDVVIYGGGERYLSVYLTETVRFPRLADDLPDLPSRDMISQEEYGSWMLANGVCIDTYNDTVTNNSAEIVLDPRYKSVRFTGWGADFYANAPFKELYLKVGDDLLLCDTGFERPDVAQGMGIETLLKTGYEIDFPTSYLDEDGETEVSFIGVSADGEYIYTPVTYRLVYR